VGSAQGRMVLDEGDLSRALTRIAHQILERNKGSSGLLLLGIPTRGVQLANRLAELISRIEGFEIPVGTLDVTLHRDDLRLRPSRTLTPTLMPVGGLEGRIVVLVDDVLFSGRTIRAALDAIGEIGRPSAVQLAVLIDRGHRQLPIRADYVGKNLPTAMHEAVKVFLKEIDGEDRVTISEVAGE
jgi:pyrimidine operon attenuation protein/uracil phosphoribosyltransferase